MWLVDVVSRRWVWLVGGIWVWLECIGVVNGCCNVVRRHIDTCPVEPVGSVGPEPDQTGPDQHFFIQLLASSSAGLALAFV